MKRMVSSLFRSIDILFPKLYGFKGMNGVKTLELLAYQNPLYKSDLMGIKSVSWKFSKFLGWCKKDPSHYIDMKRLLIVLSSHQRAQCLRTDLLQNRHGFL
jgi:hypothetical protein